MIKCKIYIYSGSDFLVNRVSVEILLPSAPRVGNYLQLGEELKNELEIKAKSSLEIAKIYAPKWFYGKSKGVEFIKDENIEDLSFQDASYVCSVNYKANDEYLYIEMTDTDITGVTALEK